MTTAVLLANVGNHDLKLADQTLLPRHEDGQYFKSPRRLGEEIRDNFQRYAGAIQIPLLGPTLHWLLVHEGYKPTDLSIHLFASDQERDDVGEGNWLKDTVPAAEVIREYINRKWQIAKKRIFIHRIEGSPADYTNMLNYYQRELPRIRSFFDGRAEDYRVYMEVSGGTPAMTSMLILMGVEVFGQDVVTLYLDRGGSPYTIGVAKALFARKTREVLRSQISLYAYAVAAKTLADNGQLIQSDEHKRALLSHLLRYADRRLAFDYDRARDELAEASSFATGTLQSRLRRWRRELEAPDAATRLAELIHSARIKLHLGDYADFTQRLFRFQEAIFRHMAEQMGIQYGKSDQYLDPKWRQSQPKLDAFLNAYPRTKDQSSSVVDTTRSLNRFSLGAIVDYFVRQEVWKRWRGAAEQIHRFSSVADLRNRGIAGHGFEGIGRADLEDAYGKDVQTLLADMEQAYESIFGQPPGENPYDIVNDLLGELIPDLTS